MAKPIHLLTVEQEGDDGLLVTFSDGTAAGYVIEELLEMRPVREHTRDPVPVSCGMTSKKGKGNGKSLERRGRRGETQRARRRGSSML